jgi:hypothetical protein
MSKISITLCAIVFACLLLGSQCLKINHFESDFKIKMNHKFQKFLDFLSEDVTEDSSSSST